MSPGNEYQGKIFKAHDTYGGKINTAWFCFFVFMSDTMSLC